MTGPKPRRAKPRKHGRSTRDGHFFLLGEPGHVFNGGLMVELREHCRANGRMEISVMPSVRLGSKARNESNLFFAVTDREKKNLPTQLGSPCLWPCRGGGGCGGRFLPSAW